MNFLCVGVPEAIVVVCEPVAQLSIFSREGGALKGDIGLAATSRSWVSGDCSWTIMGGKLSQKVVFESPTPPLPADWVAAINAAVVDIKAGGLCSLTSVLALLLRVLVVMCPCARASTFRCVS